MTEWLVKILHHEVKCYENFSLLTSETKEVKMIKKKKKKKKKKNKKKKGPPKKLLKTTQKTQISTLT